MIKIGILLITAAIITIYYIVKDLFKKEYPDERKVELIYGILGLAFIVFCIGAAIIMQTIFGPQWLVNMLPR